MAEEEMTLAISNLMFSHPYYLFTVSFSGISIHNGSVFILFSVSVHARNMMYQFVS